MTIEQIREKCTDEFIEVTGHALLRMQQRKISYCDIKNAILTGEIIEVYPEDYPYPSCLIMGFSVDAKKIHVVVGSSETKIWIVTVYYPNPEEWEENLRRRKQNG